MEHKNIVNYPLSQDDIEQLNRIRDGYDPPYVRNRAHSILLLFKDGRTFEDVADFFTTHVNTIRNWAERWIDGGIDGLYNSEGRGAKPIFSAAEEKTILECLEKEPRSLRQLVAAVEQRTGKKAGVETYRRILKKHGKSWKRQRKIVKDKPTEEEYERGKEDIEELQQLAQDGEFDLIYFDASGFTLQPYVPYAWQDIGREGTLGIPAAHSARINVFGFLNPTASQLVTFEHVGSVTSDVIIDTMDMYCDSLANPAVVLLDNAPVQTSKAVLAKREEWEMRGLTLYFIPRYSPELNLIEILWRKIKYEWMPTLAYASMKTLEMALGNIFDSFGSKYTIRFS